MNSVLVLCSAEHDTVYCESMIQICKIKLIATELPHSCGAILMSNPSNAGMNLLQSVSSVSRSSPGIYLAYFTSYIESFSLIGAFVLCHLCNILYQVFLFRLFGWKGFLSIDTWNYCWLSRSPCCFHCLSWLASLRVPNSPNSSDIL